VLACQRASKTEVINQSIGHILTIEEMSRDQPRSLPFISWQNKISMAIDPISLVFPGFMLNPDDSTHSESYNPASIVERHNRREPN